VNELIDPGWFESLATVVLLVIGAAATYVLLKGADWLVEGASGLAYRLGMPKVIVGATIVSLGTTSPEAAVSVMAEEYRSIRTSILARWEQRRNLVHLITSASPQEGKTLTSLNLGLIFPELVRCGSAICQGSAWRAVPDSWTNRWRRRCATRWADCSARERPALCWCCYPATC